MPVYEFTTANLSPVDKAAEKAREIDELERERVRIEKRIWQLRCEIYELADGLPEDEMNRVMVCYLSHAPGRSSKHGGCDATT